jgi:hypothetical protein
MRAWLIAMAAGVAFAPAAALAQTGTYSEMSPPLPTPQSPGAPFAGDRRPLSIPDPYQRKLAFLHKKMLWTQAHDGGRLTPDHAQALQRQLDALNRTSGARRD